VFQSYALWPHMTVRQNIGYPLRARRIKRDVAAQWIEEVADLVDCRPLLDRYPGQLSGGQQQRVALSRGLVARPDLVLFDEPLSNLDARLRDQVRTEIHELHQRLNFTAVYVTHDQSEALALGDRLAIMRAGAIEQLGTPEQVFEEPATEYVAGFTGMENRLTLERHDGGWMHNGEPVKGDLGFDDRSHDALTLRARPEDLQLAQPAAPVPPDAIAFTAMVADSEFGGRWMDVVLTLGGTRLHSRIPAGERGSWVRSLNAGELVVGFIRSADTTFFDPAGPRIASKRATQNPASIVGV
jgi:iron(III) transport system ATP-binding protein